MHQYWPLGRAERLNLSIQFMIHVAAIYDLLRRKLSGQMRQHGLTGLLCFG
jgi:hypothetical protein